MTQAPDYAELHCLSNFSFQRGASHADELIHQAIALGYLAIAITDECSLAGVVRAYDTIKKLEGKAPGNATIKLIIGAEFHLQDGPSFVLLAPSREAYAQISRLITRGRQTSPKGRYRLHRADCDALSLCLALWLPGEGADADEGRWLSERVAQAWIAVHQHREAFDAPRMARADSLSAQTGMRCVAAGGVLFHRAERKTLHDVLTAVRIGRPVQECGLNLLPNAERHLRDRGELAELYPPQMLAETLALAALCQFSLKELSYQYPAELVPEGESPSSHLRHLTEAGMQWRWPDGIPAAVRAQVDKELALIAELKYEAFFLTVEDIVRYARAQGILCQGRGSAANSAVCYAIGVTSVRPENENLLFERFLSKERNEPPDIDVDFEHERREEVIQYVFTKYGRHRTAIAATVICYRTRSALRDVGRALGMEPEDIDRLSKTLAWWDNTEELDARLIEQGFDPRAPKMRLWVLLTQTLVGFPRHLSQHVGGFVIAERSLDELVPIENAAMPQRQVIQWDKDDLESLGLLKVDVLALGMLTALRRSFDLIQAFTGIDYSIASIPQNDAPTYEMIRRAETIGVFQIESRAQQNMLPRLKPQNFYDLVIQIAIVRPGPITGGMVHPYLRRRDGLEKRDDPPQLQHILGRTLGIPIFQEQVMQIAITAASFTPGEADNMRRSMAAWKRSGGLEHLQDRLIKGMLDNGYERAFAEQIYQRILGFGSYGFPESHSASFALLAYASAWLKCHHPAAFTAALLNSQPMGFYPPSMLVGEARRAGVEVRAVDVLHSEWECTLEPRDEDAQPALRLGLLQISGLAEEAGKAIAGARLQSSFKNLDELARRARLTRRELTALANAGALEALSGHRHAARWEVAAQTPDTALSLARAAEPEFDLRPPTPGEDVLNDYRNIGLSLRQHPLSLFRDRLAARKVSTAKSLRETADKSKIRVAGMVMFRQRPPAAKGVMFMTIEDETGSVNLILRPRYIENNREVVLGSRLMIVAGEVQRSGSIVHVMAEKIVDITGWFSDIPHQSRDFH
ncbi:error-prone DNA polymerase [Hydrocarboniphaga sp.]|uniref:error-prone DNA polymerase n=1 Tax=Hydrocarboniphaga sp. TaxID=2033016 RepID=UPI00261A74D6|nr:error-prone DNA polymerase [Hydrocarboniphaga sp.]